MAGNGTRYPEELIQKALELSDKIGLEKTAEQLKVNYKTLSYWRGKRKKKLEEQKSKKLECVVPVLDPERELKDNPKITFQKAEKEFRRGQIYYVYKGVTVGNEIATGRPAVIVSNDRINSKFDTLTVVFLTTKSKSVMPEHVTIESSGTMATVLAETITTMDKSRFREYIGECTPEEMKAIDKAVLATMDLEKCASEMIEQPLDIRIAALMAERNAYKNMYEKLLAKLIVPH